MLQNADETNGTSDNMDKSSYSSFYSSFLRTEGSSTEERIDQESNIQNEVENEKNLISSKILKRPDPPWLDGICITSDLVYRYQINDKIIKDVLKSDLAVLKEINQVIFFYCS